MTDNDIGQRICCLTDVLLASGNHLFNMQTESRGCDGFYLFRIGLLIPARDKVEQIIRLYFSQFIPGQIIAIAFSGRIIDDAVTVYFALNNADGLVAGAAVSACREKIQNTDYRATVCYPVKAVV